jgi:CDP-glucose 4,6-dehydratase
MLWPDRSVFVTGATGFLGSWLVRDLLGRGARVVCLVRDAAPHSALWAPELRGRVEEVRGDVADQALLERALGEYEVETVFHLAAQAIVGVANRNPVSTFETNIRGTWALLEACRRSPRVAQVLFASSDKAYGAHDTLPYTEAASLQGRHPYDVSKSCADLLAQSYAVTYGLPVVITRCGNLYGGGDLHWNRIVPGTIRSVLRGERPVVRSDGSFVRDYLYVEDAAGAYIHLAEALAARPALVGEAFNFSTEVQVSVLDLVDRIRRLAGREDLEPDIRGEASHEIPHQYLDAGKARGVLGWAPVHDLDAGLRRSLAWYGDYLNRGAS